MWLKVVHNFEILIAFANTLHTTLWVHTCMRCSVCNCSLQCVYRLWKTTTTTASCAYAHVVHVEKERRVDSHSCSRCWGSDLVLRVGYYRRKSCSCNRRNNSSDALNQCADRTVTSRVITMEIVYWSHQRPCTKHDPWSHAWTCYISKAHEPTQNDVTTFTQVTGLCINPSAANIDAITLLMVDSLLLMLELPWIRRTLIRICSLPGSTIRTYILLNTYPPPSWNKT